jgi:hypothetical protein
MLNPNWQDAHGHQLSAITSQFCAGTFHDPQKLVDDFAALSPGLVAVSARVS